MSDLSALRVEMPVLVRALGVWEGTYTRVDPVGGLLDHHRGRMTCSVRPDGVYQQVNEYTWDDGHHEEIHFLGAIRDGRLRFDTERLTGEAWEVGPDAMVRRWSYKHEPNGFLWEILTLTDGDSRKARCWQHFRDGEVIAFMLISERRVG